MPTAAEVFAAPVGAPRAELRVCHAPDFLVIFRPYSPEQVDFDIDLRELRGRAKLDLFCDFLRRLGRQVGRPVLMTAEGDWGRPVVGYDPATDHVMRLASTQLENVR